MQNVQKKSPVRFRKCLLRILLATNIILLTLAINTSNTRAGYSNYAKKETAVSFLPLILSSTLHIPPPLPPPTPITATFPVDFEAVRTAAQANSMDLAFNKIGFHVGVGGNETGLEDWMIQLDTAGVPFTIKSANNAEPLFNAQQLMQTSGVPHVLIYRDVDHGLIESQYDSSPQAVAEFIWQANKDAFPPELDPSIVWLETINEPDKNRSEWLAEYSLKTAQLAVQDGFRYAAFSWSSGEPEIEDWETPEMLEFLRFAGEHPEQVAVALHEYSFEADEISRIYPWLVGRFQKLFDVCDRNGIPRPTILITEWGWEYENVPEPADALEDIAWAAWLYSAYPEVKGAAIWYLGPGFSDIADQTQHLIAPVRDYSLRNYFIFDPGFGGINESLFEPDVPGE